MLDLNKNFQDLGNAMALQNCVDYFNCRRALAQGKQSLGKIANCALEVEYCREWFYSELYHTITQGNLDLAPNKVLARLDDLVDDYDTYPLGTSPFRNTFDEEIAHE